MQKKKKCCNESDMTMVPCDGNDTAFLRRYRHKRGRNKVGPNDDGVARRHLPQERKKLKESTRSFVTLFIWVVQPNPITRIQAAEMQGHHSLKQLSPVA